MAPDILAQREYVSFKVSECRGMRSTCPPIEFLMVVHRTNRCEHADRRDRLMLCDTRQRLGQGLKIFDTAQPAGTFSNSRSHPFRQLLDAKTRQLRPCDDALVGICNSDVFNHRWFGYETFGQSKSPDKILQISRGCHHHGISKTVKFQRDGNLRHPLACDLARAAIGQHFSNGFKRRDDRPLLQDARWRRGREN